MQLVKNQGREFVEPPLSPPHVSAKNAEPGRGEITQFSQPSTAYHCREYLSKNKMSLMTGRTHDEKRASASRSTLVDEESRRRVEKGKWRIGRKM
jgi:hypothetical protein